MNSNAHEYKVNATKVALHLLREPDIFETNMKLFCAKDLEKAFIAGAEWQKKQSYTEDQIKQAILDYCDENGMDDEEAKECVDDFMNNFLNKNV